MLNKKKYKEYVESIKETYRGDHFELLEKVKKQLLDENKKGKK